MKIQRFAVTFWQKIGLLLIVGLLYGIAVINMRFISQAWFAVIEAVFVGVTVLILCIPRKVVGVDRGRKPGGRA